MTTTSMYVGIIGLSLISLWILIEAIRIAILSQRAVAAGRHAPRASNMPLRPTCSVLVIGDSTALGTGATKPEYTIAGRLAREIPNATIVNAAENAMNLKSLKQCLYDRRNEQYDYVIIHIGGIDTLSLTPFHIIRRRLNESLSLAQSIAKIQTILISVNNTGNSPFFRFPISPIVSARCAAVSKISSEVAASADAIHIPLYESKAGDPLHKKPNYFFSKDGLHPNDAGYELWYERIRKPLIQIMKHNNHVP